MHQILHIFRKDVRHHWPDILLALGILAAYAWNQPGEWHPRDPRSQISHEMILRYLPFMVMLAWSFLIARAVLTEPLVGDRQFWVTKPYEWQKLLIAKLLLVAVFVSIPLFAAQLFLLSEAGFSPAPHITDLLLIQIWWIILLLLPLATLATLTSNLAQLVLTILGIFVLLIGIAILNTRIRYAGSIPAHWLPGWIEPAILLGTAAAVVVLQYARRKTLRSRLFLIGAVFIALVISTVRKQPAFSPEPYLQSSAREQSVLQISLDPSVFDRGNAPFENNKVPVRLPVLVSGIAQDGAASLDGAMIEIEAGEMRWNSGWFRTILYFLPTQNRSELLFTVDKPFFERVKTAPATLRISLALTGYRAQEVRRVVATAGEFAVPGEAICSLWLPESRALRCRAPFGRPFLALTVLPQESTCPHNESQKDQSDNGPLSGALWGSYRSPGPALSPVEMFYLSVGRWSRNRTDQPPNLLCPGTRLNFEILRADRRARDALTVEGVRLADYQPKEWSSTGGAVGFSFFVW